MSRPFRASLLALAAVLCLGGCYGPFNLTRRLYAWNDRTGRDKWEQEFIFLLLTWAPVYSFTLLADGILFHSLEFWTGNNPVAPPQAGLGGSGTKYLVRGGQAALLTYASTPAGASLLIEQFRRGEPVGSLRLVQRRGVTIGTDGDGRILFSAASAKDGGIVILDGLGQPVVSYSKEQVQQFVDSVPR